MSGLKSKAIFVAEVAVALILIGIVQEKVMKLPVVGGYLPGGN